VDQTNKQRLFSAFLHPFSLAVGAIGGATYALSGEWWVMPLTAVVMGAIVFGQLRAAPKPVRIEVLPPGYAEREAALSALMDRIVSSVESSSSTVRACLSAIPTQISEVRVKAHALLARQARIDTFLADPNVRLSDSDLARLERSLGSARTEAARQKFSSALENKRRDLEAREDLRASSERIVAELAEIESALENTLSRIMSLGDAEASPEESAGISSDLSEVLLTVQSLEQALTELQDPNTRRQA
jgi:hypothetical protein